MGAALRLAPAAPTERSASPPSLPWWRPGDAPTISFGVAYDHDFRRSEGADEEVGIEHVGGEETLLGLVSVRVGYVSDQGITYGAGVTLPVGPWGSLGYDFADVPLASGLDRQQRHGWSVSLDPVRFWRPAP